MNGEGVVEPFELLAKKFVAIKVTKNEHVDENAKVQNKNDCLLCCTICGLGPILLPKAAQAAAQTAAQTAAHIETQTVA